jgi:uncharacterized protein YeaO (DUF488 family)
MRARTGPRPPGGRRSIPAPTVRIKRAYESARPGDGKRILVDRLWPRGLTRAAARLESWRRELAPSTELRRWYGHDPAKFDRFRARYRMEVLRHQEALVNLVLDAERGPVTLVCATRDVRRSNAAVLKELLEEIR